MVKKILRSLKLAGIEVEENSTAMLAYWDENLICRFANDAYYDWFGVKPETMINRMSIQQLLGRLYIKNRPYIEGALNGKVQVFNRDIISPFGKTRNSIATYCPAYDGDTIKGFYVHVEDSALITNRIANTELNKRPKDVIAEVKATLEANLLSTFPGINQLAKQHFISESKLKKDFKVRFNKSIFSYYRYLQMELAEKSIREKTKNKKELASLLGFTNSTNFIICYQKHLKEKSSEKVIEELTEANDDRYKTFITQAPFAIAMLDSEMIVKAASQKYVDDYHLNKQPLIGSNYYDLFPAYHLKWKKIHNAALKGKIQSGEDYVFERQNGSLIWTRWDVRPWRKHDGKIGGVLIFTEDITATKLKEQENAKILQILNKANEIIRIGVWKKNFKTGTGYWNNVTREILELPDDVQPSAEFALEFYKKGKSRSMMQKLLKEAIELGKSFDVKAEILTARGNHKTVRVVGYSEFRNGKCERLFGIFQEIISAINFPAK